MLLGIYLLGSLIAYIISRHLERKICGDKYNWGHVLGNLKWSILSWCIVVLAIVGWIIERIEKIRERVRLDGKPPRWL